MNNKVKMKNGKKINIVCDAIKRRRSIRVFLKKDISKEDVKTILEAARWAPSGLNNQPWNFLVLEKDKKNKISRFTHYDKVVESADKIILVFLDKERSYNREKDFLAIGAAIQNMLLCAYSIGISTCWLGEILNKKEDIRKYLKLDKSKELTTVIALGFSEEKAKSTRKALKNILLKVK